MRGPGTPRPAPSGHLRRIVTMNPTLHLLAAVLPCLSGIAQSVTVTAATPITVFTQIGANLTTNSVSAGPLAAVGTVSAAAVPFASASLSHSATFTPSRFHFTASASSLVAVGPQVAAGLQAPVELLLSLTHPLPATMRIDLDQRVLGPAGMPMPLLAVDVGDDGSVELSTASSSPHNFVLVQVSPTPVAIRIRLGIQLASIGQGEASVELVGRPTATQVTSMLPGCASPIVVYEPRFDGDLEFELVMPTLDPLVMVFGLGMQAQLLGSFGSYPCLLLPPPDAVLLLPPQSRQSLSIPPAVRPIQVFAQPVEVTLFGLRTGEAVRISAN